MFIVGLTGGIASGKSTVSKVFEKHGIPVVDSDVIARSVVEPGKKAWHNIQKHFGDSVFTEEGKLDRKKLGDVIFSSTEKRLLLNSITHPEIHKEMIWLVIKYFFQGYQFIVLDIPLLFETRTVLNFTDKIITVYCDEELQLQRLQKRNDLTNEESKRRVAAQMPLKKKCDMSDFVIDNNGTLESTIEQTENIIKYLKSLDLHRVNKIRIAVLAVMAVAVFGLIGTGLWFLVTGRLRWN